MQLKIIFPFKILRGLCLASEETVSLEGAKKLVLSAIDPDQNKLSGIREPFKKTIFRQSGLLQTLSVSFNGNVSHALGHTEATLPKFVVDSLNEQARKVLKEESNSIRLG
jgi:hypothetical protein